MFGSYLVRELPPLLVYLNMSSDCSQYVSLTKLNWLSQVEEWLVAYCMTFDQFVYLLRFEKWTDASGVQSNGYIQLENSCSPPSTSNEIQLHPDSNVVFNTVAFQDFPPEVHTSRSDESVFLSCQTLPKLLLMLLSWGKFIRPHYLHFLFVFLCNCFEIRSAWAPKCLISFVDVRSSLKIVCSDQKEKLNWEKSGNKPLPK